jgi:NAD(P)H-dependent FMN reductase
MTKILAFSGSAREGSFNQKLVAAAAQGAAGAGAEVTVINLADYPAPLYDGDLEANEGIPEKIQTLKKLFGEHDALLIASPEYNGSLSALLKNTLDWVSRPDGDEPMLAAYRGKTAAIVAASPGGLGGLRGLVHLRQVLTNLGVLVIPDQQAVSKAHEVFGEDGGIADEKMRAGVEKIGAELARVAGGLLVSGS